MELLVWLQSHMTNSDWYLQNQTIYKWRRRIYKQHYEKGCGIGHNYQTHPCARKLAFHILNLRHFFFSQRMITWTYTGAALPSGQGFKWTPWPGRIYIYIYITPPMYLFWLMWCPCGHFLSSKNNKGLIIDGFKLHYFVADAVCLIMIHTTRPIVVLLGDSGKIHCRVSKMR